MEQESSDVAGLERPLSKRVRVTNDSFAQNDEGNLRDPPTRFPAFVDVCKLVRVTTVVAGSMAVWINCAKLKSNQILFHQFVALITKIYCSAPGLPRTSTIDGDLGIVF